MKLFIAMFLFMPLMTRAGDTAGNGSGLAERNVVAAYTNIGRYISFCLNSASCKPTMNQKDILRKILESLSNEKPLEFKDDQDFFKIGDEIKVARTGDNAGDTIYINSVLIYQKDFDDDYKTMSVSEAAGLLVHELSHHHGVKDEVQADLLGSLIQNIVSGVSQRVEGGFLISYIVGNAINYGIQDTAQIWFTDGENFVDLSKLINNAAYCPVREPKIGSHFSNPHWSAFYRKGPNRWSMRFQGRLVTFCRGPNMIFNAARDGFQVIIEADLRGGGGKGLKYIPGTARLVN